MDEFSCAQKCHIINIQIYKMASVLSVQPTARGAMDQVITIIYHAIRIIAKIIQHTWTTLIIEIAQLISILMTMAHVILILSSTYNIIYSTLS